MADSDWLIAGLLIGLLVGIPFGWMISQMTFNSNKPQSVTFDRDEDGRITGIHYVPMGCK